MAAAPRPGFRTQLDTLFERNLAILLGSRGTLAVFLLQPPIIGLLIGLAWRDTEASETTYFVLALSAIYLGCMNACSSIVKERTVLERERMTGLRLWPYLLAKLQMLSLIGCVQSLLLLLVSAQYVLFPDGALRHALLLGILSLTSITATGLGLAISAFARTTYVAVIVVPLLILPQIIFSEVVLGSRFDTPTLGFLGQITITKWSYDALVASTLAWEWGTLLLCPVVLVAMLAACVGTGAVKLKLDGP